MLKNIFSVLGLILLLSSAGCHKGCGGGCQNGGSCEANTCVCPDPWSGTNCDTMCQPGYEGYMCRTYSKEKFFGAWNCSSTDPSGNTKNFLITFTDYPSQPGSMYLTNFNDEGYAVPCTMTGKYEFQVQDSSTTYPKVYDDGFAKLNNGTLTMYITENNVNYFAKATKQ